MDSIMFTIFPDFTEVNLNFSKRKNKINKIMRDSIK